MALKPGDIIAGMDLPELKRGVTQAHINRYAEASGDFNPIHLDPEFARRTPAGGTIAHGMLILAYVSEFMAVNFGSAWLSGGRLSARFKTPARPGDTVTVGGRVTTAVNTDGFIDVNCEVLCRNQRGEPVIVCETKVKVREDEDSR
jgi:3-hydroxybutyryl-CoA dehydratase